MRPHFASGAANSSEITDILRKIVRKLGHGAINGGFGFLLALLHGNLPLMSISDRRLFGGQAKPGERTPMEHSRDAMAGPLHRLQVSLTVVRNGAFKPGQARSLRWKPGSSWDRIARGRANEENDGSTSPSSTSVLIFDPFEDLQPSTGALHDEQHIHLMGVIVLYIPQALSRFSKFCAVAHSRANLFWLQHR